MRIYLHKKDNQKNSVETAKGELNQKRTIHKLINLRLLNKLIESFSSLTVSKWKLKENQIVNSMKEQ